MAMQKKAWMTGTLFNEWINHFLHHVGIMYGISTENRHLLIMDGHNSHVTIDVAHTARKVGLDLLTIPSHTSHATQPLDVSIFKPFKTAFRKYRDFWTIRNKGKGAAKEDLAQWVSLALKKAMTPTNIKKGFSATGIWPLNRTAMDDKMGPSKVFVNTPDVVDEEEVDDEHVKEVFGEKVPQTQGGGTQYMVALRDDEGDTMHGVHEGVEMGRQDTDEVCMVSQELDGVDMNATLRLRSIWPFLKQWRFLDGIAAHRL